MTCGGTIVVMHGSACVFEVPFSTASPTTAMARTSGTFQIIGTSSTCEAKRSRLGLSSHLDYCIQMCSAVDSHIPIQIHTCSGTLSR